MSKNSLTHTSGPWTAKERITEPDNHGKYSIYSPDNEYVGTCDAYLNGHHDEMQNQANARLIAQAPTLLAALEGINDYLDESNPDYFPVPEVVRGIVYAAIEAVS